MIDELIDVMKKEHKTSRICLHSSINDPVHQSVIVTSNKFENRIHYHPTKPETIYPLVGEAVINLYDKEKRKIEEISIRKDFQLAATITTNSLHNFTVNSEVFIFLEVSKGPFTRNSTIYVE